MSKKAVYFVSYNFASEDAKKAGFGNVEITMVTTIIKKEQVDEMAMWIENQNEKRFGPTKVVVLNYILRFNGLSGLVFLS